MTRSLVRIALVVALACLAGHAHEGLHAKLAKATEAIADAPGAASLYLKRADLHRRHRDWPAAYADLRRAEDLDVALEGLDLAWARYFRDNGEPRRAAVHAERELRARPRSEGALVLRAELAVELGDHAGAAAALARAIAAAPQPTPELFVVRARALASLGDVDAAVGALDDGLAALGPLPALQNEAIELELGRGGYDAALARIDARVAQAARKESLLARRGDVLLAAGRPDAAREAFLAAQAALAELKPRRRTTRAMQELDLRLRAALRDL